MPIISTNDVRVHRDLLMRKIEIGDKMTLGRLVDIYARIGLDLSLEKLNDEDIQRLKEILNKGKE